MTYLRWYIKAYLSRDEGHLYDVVELWLYADNREQALERAREMYAVGPEGGYVISSITEHFDGQCLRADA